MTTDEISWQYIKDLGGFGLKLSARFYNCDSEINLIHLWEMMEKERSTKRSELGKFCSNYTYSSVPFIECSIVQLWLRNTEKIAVTTKKSSGVNATKVRELVPRGKEGISLGRDG